MIWKTDWSYSDNYARDGTADVERLLSNLLELQQQFWDVMKMKPYQERIVLDGYYTFAFADLLNQIEGNVISLNELDLPDFQGPETWYSGNAIRAETINRWEQNGKITEEELLRIRSDQLVCGEFYAGNDFDDQYYEGVG